MRRNGKLVLLQTVLACLLVMLASAVVYGSSLQEEFDKICVHTQDAESLSLEKLQELITKADQLQKALEVSNDPKKKLLLFRLSKCRNFFSYVIDLKQEGNSSSPQ
jgi:hypothetical protein